MGTVSDISFKGFQSILWGFNDNFRNLFGKLFEIFLCFSMSKGGSEIRILLESLRIRIWKDKVLRKSPDPVLETWFLNYKKKSDLMGVAIL
jgi:hypothetical protein